MNKIITLFVGLLLGLSAFGQVKSKVDYDNDSRWFWDINAGAAWNTNDVKNKTDWGWGLTLGKSFNYNYGRTFSFDIRGRYLTGKWYGQNYDSTNFAYPNQALSSAGYDSVVGFGVLNHLTRVHQAGLELVIHANNLRARTGWDFFVFGGINYTWYNARGNLYGTNDSIYRYDELSTLNKSSVDGLLDGSYESDLDGSKKGVYNADWMPSLGFGIGYQVGPRFSIGFEHKTTFTLLDNFDGYENPSSKYKDIFHYTSAYLRFQIKDHRVYVEDNNNLGNVDNYDNTTTTNTNVPPVVDFRSPATSGTTVNSPSYVIKADIRNVAGSNNVIFRQNGAYVTNFVFNPSTQKFESSVTLQPGQNVFELTGTNNYGSDQETTIIIYTREQQNPPIVNYINPSSSPTTVTNPVYNLSATVLNVTQQSQVEMKVNGQTNQAFTFNPSTNVVTAAINLQLGTNIVTTTGTNQYGQDSESTTIIYRPQQTEQPPVVYFVDPNVNPYTVSSPNFTINADVLNVAGGQNIVFKQNGSVNQNFTYNASTDDFRSAVVLNPGQNVFEIIASNTAGTAQASTIIIYERAAPKPPVVTITNPPVSPYEVSNQYFPLSATVLNVTQASQISVKLNGQSVTNFVYNQSTNGVSANLTLIQGSNVVVVTGTNNDGTDSKQVIIVYRPAQTIQPPTVVFTNPSTDPFTTNNGTMTVLASVAHVSNQSGVNVNMNGQNITNFTFNGTNGITSIPVVLLEGANVITVTGTNTAGTASETQTIIYKKPVTVQPPVVTFVDPTVNPQMVYNPVYNLKARVRFVSGAQQITLRINGQLSSTFSYSLSSEIMDFTSGLVPGANTFEITATNAAGTDQKSTTIIYRVPDPAVPPVVTIINPVPNPYSVSVPTTPIAATVLNVDGAQNIQVLVNGANLPDFVYNASTKQVSFVMNLVLGSNSVEVKATNSAGQASDSKIILYKREVVPVPPTVTFTHPSAPGTVVSVAGYTVKAIVTQVNEANQIVVYQNGQTVVPSLWSFNPGTKEVIMNTTLNNGNNIFTVTGTNAAGSNTATTNITYTPPVVVCDKPVINFQNPAAPGTMVSAGIITITASVQHVTSVNDITLLVNGVPQTAGMLNGNVYTKEITLSSGQNSVEITAGNKCGTTKGITTISYRPAAAPCKESSLQRLAPLENITGTEATSVTISAGTSNIENASQLTMTLNGQSYPFLFDEGSHLVTANVNLVVGLNRIVLKSKNGCEVNGSEISWEITRIQCSKPVITITGKSVEQGAATTASAFSMTLSVTGVTNANQIKITRDNQELPFVYSAQTNVVTFDTPLNMGINKFLVTVANACGTAMDKININRIEEPKKNPPVINFTNPAQQITQTTNSGMTINAATSYVSGAGNVSVLVNGAAVNFDYNAANGTLTFNTVFQVGENIITGLAVNEFGSSSDSRTVIYTPQVAIPAPVITITNPERCPAGLTVGNHTITGTVANVTNSGEVTIMFNNVLTPFNSSISGNVLTFSFDVNMSAASVNLPIVITATNVSGTATKSCKITVTGVTTTGTGTSSTGTAGQSNPGGNPGTTPIPKPGTGGTIKTPGRTPATPPASTPATIPGRRP